MKKLPCTRIAPGPIAAAMLAVPLMIGGLVAPQAHAQDASATEGGTVRFEIEKPRTLSGAYVSRMIRYSYRTQNGTAAAGKDYKTAIGKVVFSTGAQYAYVSVSTYSDDIDEGAGETFRLQLTDPQIMSGSGTRSQWTSTSLLPLQITMTALIVEP